MKLVGQNVASLKSKSPEIWRGVYGKMHYRNNFCSVEGVLYFGTCGDIWNSPDESDSVLAVDAGSGALLWELGVGGDVNHVAASEKFVFCGTDGGEIISIRRGDGVKVSDFLSDSPAINTFHSRRVNPDAVFTFTQAGDIVMYDPVRGRFAVKGSVPVLGSVVCSAFSYPDAYIGSDQGIVYHVNMDTLLSRPLFIIPSRRKESYILRTEAATSISIAGDRLIVTYSRETYDEVPPLICIDKDTGAVLWGDPGSPLLAEKSGFGNARATPLILNGKIYCTFAYNDALSVFSLSDGRFLDSVRLDNAWFQNWASPVAARGKIIVPRVSGVIAQVDPETLKIDWMNSIEGNYRREALEGAKEDDWPDFRDRDSGPYPAENLSKGITATPLYSEGSLFVGTVSGQVVCLKI